MNLFTLAGEIAIKYEDAETAIDNITEKARTLSGTFTAIGNEADTSGEKLNNKNSAFHSASVWLGNMLTELTQKAARLAMNLTGIGFDFNASMEMYQAQFSALLNSEEKAEGLVASIQELAKVSPLGMEGLAKNTVSLLSAGVKLENIMPTLEMLGNLALGDPAKMDSITRAYYQMMNKGKLYAQEINQFTEAGVPLIELLNKYGGERFADGTWYAQMQKDAKSFVVTAEEINNAFLAATSEGGDWYQFMDTMMTTYAGILDRTKEEGKETLGAFFQPFFDVAKEDVLPKITESLGAFQEWITDNKDDIAALATTLGEVAVMAFDGLLDLFKFVTENPEAVGDAFTVIGAAITTALASSHPYMAALATVISGYTSLKLIQQELEESTFQSFYFDGNNDGITEDHLVLLQRYIEAMREYEELQATFNESGGERIDLIQPLTQAKRVIDALEPIVNPKDSSLKYGDILLNNYKMWLDFAGKSGWVDVLEPGSTENWREILVKVSGDSESQMQSDLDAMDLSTSVKVNPDYSSMNRTILQQMQMATGNYDGSHASGLDYVPFDGYRAILHRGETVLNAEAASAWRSGQTGDTGRVEAALGRVESLLQQIISNTGAGQTVVLDSGILVGQIAQQMDTQLGMIGNRRGRGN